MAVVSMKQLLESGVHFGHQTRRWNPKMAQYIFTERNGIYIIDLQKTVRKIEEAYEFVKDLAEAGGTLLFVGTKKQAHNTVREEAERCGMFYVNERWLGGMLTNFETIKSRVERLKELEQMEEDGSFELLPKKEVMQLRKEHEKLQRYLGGIREMKRFPMRCSLSTRARNASPSRSAQARHSHRRHRRHELRSRTRSTTSSRATMTRFGPSGC